MDTDYKSYLSNIFKLAKTIVIKSKETASLINEQLVSIYGDAYVNQLDPTTWKYYQNICGQYHKSDTSMKVISWDTAEEIEFNKDNLELHTATRNAYSFGTNQYNELVSTYPDQEMLVLGILYPATMSTAVSGDDGTILAYPSDVVEEYEVNFIPQLQSWIYGYLLRWRNEQYAIVDDLYTATNLGIMYLFIIPAAIVIRKRACKTNEVHSYHIKQYLLSAGIDADIIQYLNREQQLFLYRNINYIRRHPGHKDTFNTLVSKLMSLRNIPVASYVMKHNSKDQLSSLSPDVVFAYKPINNVYNNGTEYRTAKNLLDKEAGLSTENNTYIADKSTDITNTLRDSLSDTVETKVLETAITDYEETGQYSLETISLNYWVYLATNGLMKSYVRIYDVKTDSSSLHSSRDAFIIMIYAFAKIHGINMVNVPDYPAIMVEKLPAPTKDDILKIVDINYVAASRVDDILSLHATINPITSLTQFQALCSKIRTSMINQRNYTGLIEDSFGRAIIQNAVGYLYCDEVCKLVTTPTTYKSWLASRFIDFSGYTTADYNTLYEAVVNTVTGLDLSTLNSVAKMHAAMIRLFTQLSSYSIQFIKQATNVEYIDFTIPQIRINMTNALQKDDGEFGAAPVDIIDTTAMVKDGLDLDLDYYERYNDLNNKVKTNLLMNPAPVEIGNEINNLVIHLDMDVSGAYFSSDNLFNE